MIHKLIDIGANLTHDSFDADRSEVVRRALDAGVEHMIITGSTVTESQKALDLSATDPRCFSATVGIHPHHASGYDDETIPQMRQMLSHPLAVAVGECGLDWYRNFSTVSKQERAFASQLELACELDMPLFLHQRDAHDAFLAILKTFKQLPPAVAHCFTGNKEELKDYLDLDLYIGITGWICDERRGHHLQDLISYIPHDRLMIETDAPYLLPRNITPKPKSRRNEPSFLSHVAQTVADASHRTLAEVATSTRENAQRFFHFDKRSQ